jgi:hypothetical protein
MRVTRGLSVEEGEAHVTVLLLLLLLLLLLRRLLVAAAAAAATATAAAATATAAATRGDGRQLGDAGLDDLSDGRGTEKGEGEN